ncbi:RNA polymerase sigma factor [Parafrankia discariae]|uniref:RNA polymerase sigma factor n=1 Tax=Parafrankia discariae TaxID=365528 RepID=UPI0007C63FDC|nr:sigma-70 family RNA polymerase sigma factor [Parafrankia discariae]
MHDEDAELAARAGGGDRRAFETLVRRHQAGLYGICRRITCDDQDALDALQDTLIILWRRIGEFEGRSRVSTWLYRVATNAAIDEVRRRSRRPDPAATLPEPLASGPSLSDQLADRLDLDRAVARLPPQFRAAIVLREFCGLSYQEIAEIRGIPVQTVKSQISRGRRALAELLGLPGAENTGAENTERN